MKKFLLPLLLLSSLRLSAQLTILNCPSGTVEFCDNTPNSETHFNNGATDLCEGPVILSIEVADTCAVFNPVFSYTLNLDLDGNGSQETEIASSNPNSFPVVATSNGANKIAAIEIPNDAVWGGQLPYGTHKISWQAGSSCSGAATVVCSYQFLVKDCKKPTVVCFNGLAVNLMNVSPPIVQVWASEVLNSGYDNCTPSWDLKYRIRIAGTGTGIPATNQTSVHFDCDDLGTQTVELWAGDAAGNWDFCSTPILVKDKQSKCDTLVHYFSGVITNVGMEGLENVQVSVEDCNGILPDYWTMSSANGEFEFTYPLLPPGECAVVTPSSDGDPLQWPSTFDYVVSVKKVQNHILGIAPLGSPYEMIAADVNGSGSITSLDLVILKKALLNLPGFPGFKWWRFIPKSFVFPNPANPWATPIPESLTVKPDSNFSLDFIGIKIGVVH